MNKKCYFSNYFIYILDTAGLRLNPNDIVEEEGVKRAINAANSADIIIFVQDVTHEFSEMKMEEFGLEDTGQIKLNLVNKIDILEDNSVNNLSSDINGSKVSGLTGQGLDQFLNLLTENVQKLCETQSGQNCPGLTRERHKLHLSKAIEFIQEWKPSHSFLYSRLGFCPVLGLLDP